ncbi:MAG: hypothetical protein GYA57_08890, partial [Myxococcales bacterium]|nr:hypothetical protein [Myxococcales bacterium]
LLVLMLVIVIVIVVVIALVIVTVSVSVSVSVSVLAPALVLVSVSVSVIVPAPALVLVLVSVSVSVITLVPPSRPRPTATTPHDNIRFMHCAAAPLHRRVAGDRARPDLVGEPRPPRALAFTDAERQALAGQARHPVAAHLRRHERRVAHAGQTTNGRPSAAATASCSSPWPHRGGRSGKHRIGEPIRDEAAARRIARAIVNNVRLHGNQPRKTGTRFASWSKHGRR